MIERSTPKSQPLHLSVDNYATHQQPQPQVLVQAGLAQHPRFHMPFTPTRSSGLNRVERLFRDIPDKRLRRGAFTRVADLEVALNEYRALHHANPKPLI